MEKLLDLIKNCGNLSPMKLSTYGILREKLDNSGINGAPIITDKELIVLRTEIMRLINVAKDIEDRPMKQYFNLEFNTVDNVIFNRQFR
jgi:hypothetical protein